MFILYFCYYLEINILFVQLYKDTSINILFIYLYKNNLKELLIRKQCYITCLYLNVLSGTSLT